MRVVVAGASLGHHVPIVLQHVEVVVAHDAVHLARGVVVSGGYTQVNRLALEFLRLPIRTNVGYQPVAHGWIAQVERAGCSVEASLRPIYHIDQISSRGGEHHRPMGLIRGERFWDSDTSPLLRETSRHRGGTSPGPGRRSRRSCAGRWLRSPACRRPSCCLR